jgi:triphosphoribosyl-dephospho-CoA synthase
LNWAKTEETIAQCGAIAALLEVSGYPKPGNVHRTRDFQDTRYEHFLISSMVLFPVLQGIAYRGKCAQQKQIPLNELKLGEAILTAVKDTRQWQQGGNTNLGIILLFIPLACAAGMLLDHPRENLNSIIKNSTSDDTMKLYEAIRIANPGGLGSVEKFDLNTTSPTVLQQEQMNLYEIFRISAERDSIAREWISNFHITFEVGFPYFKDVLEKTKDINTSTVHTYLKILADIPDTLISRKYGREMAEHISRQANHVLKAGGLLTEQSKLILWNFDSEVRQKEKINPGTTADLTAAAIMVALIEGMRF